MIEEVDRDGSGSIEFQEFLQLMDRAEKEKWTKKELKQVFTVFDKVRNIHVDQCLNIRVRMVMATSPPQS